MRKSINKQTGDVSVYELYERNSLIDLEKERIGKRYVFTSANNLTKPLESTENDKMSHSHMYLASKFDLITLYSSLFVHNQHMAIAQYVLSLSFK